MKVLRRFSSVCAKVYLHQSILLHLLRFLFCLAPRSFVPKASPPVSRRRAASASQLVHDLASEPRHGHLKVWGKPRPRELCFRAFERPYAPRRALTFNVCVGAFVFSSVQLTPTRREAGGGAGVSPVMQVVRRFSSVCATVYLHQSILLQVLRSFCTAPRAFVPEASLPVSGRRAASASELVNDLASGPRHGRPQDLGSRMLFAEYLTARTQGATQPMCDLSLGATSAED